MKFIPAALLAAFATAVPAQSPPTDYTTPEGAAFIHQQIKDQIISFKPDGDTDFIYFTAILGWRCRCASFSTGSTGGWL